MLIEKNSSSIYNSIGDICEIYMFYANNIWGRLPILIYPSEDIKHDADKMLPINIHGIWHLGIEEKTPSEQIGLRYRGKIYLANKMFLNSRIKTVHLSDYKEVFNPRIIVIILALPINLSNFGGYLLDKLSESIMLRFEFSLYQLIESEIAKREKIRTLKIEEQIKKGENVKKKIRNLIGNICYQFFSYILD